MKRLMGTALACAVFGTLSAVAGDFDGSKLLICAPVEVMDCVAGEECVRGLPQDIGAPAFVRIDFASKSIIGPNRTTKIQLTEQSEGQLLLQGTELGHGWTIALDQDTGAFTASLVNLEGVFVLFGSCTPL
jgi:hypothetical protein